MGGGFQRIPGKGAPEHGGSTHASTPGAGKRTLTGSAAASERRPATGPKAKRRRRPAESSGLRGGTKPPHVVRAFAGTGTKVARGWASPQLTRRVTRPDRGGYSGVEANTRCHGMETRTAAHLAIRGYGTVPFRYSFEHINYVKVSGSLAASYSLPRATVRSTYSVGTTRSTRDHRVRDAAFARHD